MSRKMVLMKEKVTIEQMKEQLPTRIMSRLVPYPARNLALTILTALKLIPRSQLLWVSIFAIYFPI